MSRARTSSRRPSSPKDGRAAYRAPALEKGLDVLELLANQAEGLILSQIAQRLNRSVQEVYRVVVSLERRGYVTRGLDGDAFQLSMKLFDLASNHLPVRRLIRAAHPLLDQLAMAVEQIVLLSVLDGVMTRVIVVAENPAPIGFRVRLGTQRPALRTASGRVLLAFQPDPVKDTLIEALSTRAQEAGDDPGPLIKRMQAIRQRGYELVSNETLRGITDISFPILDSQGTAQAALTMPFLDWVGNEVRLEEAEQKLFDCALALTREIGGHLPRPAFPLSEE